MDPNNTQQPNTQNPQINMNPTQQVNANPMQPPPPPPNPAPSTPIPPPSQSTNQKNGKKGLLLILILLVLIAGMGAYVLFAKNELNKPAGNTSVIIPSITSTPAVNAPETVEEIIIASPDADLLDLEKDLQEL